MLLKRTKFQRFLNCTILVQTFLFFDCFWIKTNEWVNELTNCHWRRFSTSSWVNELREYLNRNNILAVKQSSSEQRLNQSTWTEVEPLQRARPRNDLSQRRGISGYNVERSDRRQHNYRSPFPFRSYFINIWNKY